MEETPSPSSAASCETVEGEASESCAVEEILSSASSPSALIDFSAHPRQLPRRSARRAARARGGRHQGPVCATRPAACELGRTRAAVARAMRDHGICAGLAAAERSAHPWRPTSRGLDATLEKPGCEPLPSRHLRPPT